MRLYLTGRLLPSVVDGSQGDAQILLASARVAGSSMCRAGIGSVASGDGEACRFFFFCFFWGEGPGEGERWPWACFLCFPFFGCGDGSGEGDSSSLGEGIRSTSSSSGAAGLTGPPGFSSLEELAR